MDANHNNKNETVATSAGVSADSWPMTDSGLSGLVSRVALRPATGQRSPDKMRNSLIRRSGDFSAASSGEIVCLNVGGQRISTTRQTLTSIPDTFFTALLSGRIPSLKDSNGAIFIDRDPKIFNLILSYMRTRLLPSFDDRDFDSFRHEAEFYSISPLVQMLQQCDSHSNQCGDVMFQAHLRCIPDAEMSPGRSSLTRESKGDAVIQIIAHHNAVAIVRPHYVTCYRLKDSLGWQRIYETERIAKGISGVAFCYNCGSIGTSPKLMLGIAQEKFIMLRAVKVNAAGVCEPAKDIGKYQLQSKEVDALFFIGPRLVALSFPQGRVGVWHAGSPNWLEQALGHQVAQVITAYDKVDCIKYCNYLLLGTQRGALFLIDMHKFPLRLKDGDLLISELYQDPDREEITSISCYLTRPDNTRNGNSIEIAYGTRDGTVRVLVQHPETVGHGPQLFQSFKVHLSGISSVMLSEKFLISMCEKMHVRTWTLTRFRGLISTQPGSTPHASFSLFRVGDSATASTQKQQHLPQKRMRGMGVGPFGDQEDAEKQVFIESIRPVTGKLNVRLASNGQRICTLNSIDGSNITAYCVHECEAVAMGSRSRRYILTGHSGGHVQVWDLTTGFEKSGHSNTLLTPSQIMKELM
jgi:hypothetical protein